MTELAIAAVAGYLLGSIPWGLLLPRLRSGVDIRAVGSGNMGAANVWRAIGFKWAVAVGFLDLLKGTAAAALGLWLGGEWAGLAGGIGAMLGHYRPLFLGFARGGKIVATTVGVVFALAPLSALCAAVVWWVLFLATRYTSVASMAAAVSLPLFGIVFGVAWPVVAFMAGAAAAIILLHRANIGRLLHGNESRFRLGRRQGSQA
jgi:acyl phosphate:glycerol-3-phosphate acyltransferase